MLRYLVRGMARALRSTYNVSYGLHGGEGDKSCGAHPFQGEKRMGARHPRALVGTGSHRAKPGSAGA